MPIKTNLRLPVYLVHLVKTCIVEGVCYFVNDTTHKGMFHLMKLYWKMDVLHISFLKAIR